MASGSNNTYEINTNNTSMKPLSKTLTELGITFTFPIEIKDANGRATYHEDSNGFWCRWERDANGDVDYYEDSTGVKKGTPKSAKK
jgi:hypothetical protein